MGFSVRELADVFGERDRGGVPCARVRKLAAEKLAALEAQLRDLRKRRSELRRTLTEWDSLLGRTPRGKQARLLEAFAATHPKSRLRKSQFRLLTHGNQKREKRR
jgi:DNA-binding transcriptional MerR regulator